MEIIFPILGIHKALEIELLNRNIHHILCLINIFGGMNAISDIFQKQWIPMNYLTPSSSIPEIRLVRSKIFENLIVIVFVKSNILIGRIQFGDGSGQELLYRIHNDLFYHCHP